MLNGSKDKPKVRRDGRATLGEKLSWGRTITVFAMGNQSGFDGTSLKPSRSTLLLNVAFGIALRNPIRSRLFRR